MNYTLKNVELIKTTITREKQIILKKVDTLANSKSDTETYVIAFTVVIGKKVLKTQQFKDM